MLLFGKNAFWHRFMSRPGIIINFGNEITESRKGIKMFRHILMWNTIENP